MCVCVRGVRVKTMVGKPDEAVAAAIDRKKERREEDCTRMRRKVRESGGDIDLSAKRPVRRFCVCLLCACVCFFLSKPAHEMYKNDQ